MDKQLKEFFMVEIRNEDFGGVNPANLSSAIDSWNQSPDEVKKSWINGNDSDIKRVEKELNLFLKHSKNKEKELRDYL